MIRAGELREKLKIQRPSRVANGSGGYITTYSDLINTYAMVVEKRSSGDLIGSQENITNSVQFRIRFRPVLNIQIGDRLVWRDYNFTINNILVDPLRTSIDIFVNAQMESSRRVTETSGAFLTTQSGDFLVTQLGDFLITQ